MERPCTLMRLLSPKSACVRLADTGAFILIELAQPLSPRALVRAQRVHALSPAQATVTLGRYHVARHAFTDCLLSAQLPEPDYPRVGYLKRKQPTSPPPPAASAAPPPHSGPAQDSGPAPDASSASAAPLGE